MKDSVSSRRLSVFPLVAPLVAALSVVWVASMWIKRRQT